MLIFLISLTLSATSELKAACSVVAPDINRARVLLDENPDLSVTQTNDVPLWSFEAMSILHTTNPTHSLTLSMINEPGDKYDLECLELVIQRYATHQRRDFTESSLGYGRRGHKMQPMLHGVVHCFRDDENRMTRVVNSLLNEGADVNALDGHGEPAISYLLPSNEDRISLPLQQIAQAMDFEALVLNPRRRDGLYNNPRNLFQESIHAYAHNWPGNALLLPFIASRVSFDYAVCQAAAFMIPPRAISPLQHALHDRFPVARNPSLFSSRFLPLPDIVKDTINAECEERELYVNLRVLQRSQLLAQELLSPKLFQY